MRDNLWFTTATTTSSIRESTLIPQVENSMDPETDEDIIWPKPP